MLARIRSSVETESGLSSLCMACLTPAHEEAGKAGQGEREASTLAGHLSPSDTQRPMFGLQTFGSHWICTLVIQAGSLLHKACCKRAQRSSRRTRCRVFGIKILKDCPTIFSAPVPDVHLTLNAGKMYVAIQGLLLEMLHEMGFLT